MKAGLDILRLFGLSPQTFFSLPTPGPSACDTLRQSLNIPATSIILTEHHTNGTQVALIDQVDSCGGPQDLVNITADLCRIVVNVSTSSISAVQVEAWLPDSWNRRFLATGNGGEAGCIDYITMQNGASLGFASFGTNNGHNGSTGYDFFLDQPEVLNDFGHRAVHVEAEAGKEIVKQYYGVKPNKNYFMGCSTGGRQAFQSALMYPDDFDGVVAGAPGVEWLKIVASKGILARRIGWPQIHSKEYVRPEQWSAIVEQQIKMLDPLDGVMDGIIDDPTRFRFDPQILACGTGLLNESVCLTPAQIPSVMAAYKPIAASKGQIIYPSFDLGANTDVFGKNINQSTGEPQMSYRLLEDFWRGAIYNSTTWTPSDFSANDLDFALSINPGRVNTHETDLSAFRARGGKIIAYHGRADQTVTSSLSSRYFTNVQATLGASLDDMHTFYRLFYVPGMHHCYGGPGAWSLGQRSPLDPRQNQTEHNVLLSLVEWVERGREPNWLVGTKYAGDRGEASGVVEGQRRHCVYPNVSRWNRDGATQSVASWDCVRPGDSGLNI